MPRSTNIRPLACELYFLPIQTRVPLKFGDSILTHVTCARVRLTVERSDGQSFVGWGETPLSVPWVWPSKQSYEDRHERLKQFCRRLTSAWPAFGVSGDPFEVGMSFQQEVLGKLWRSERGLGEPMPWLAALVCCSPFDIALHDAFGQACGRPVYETYSSEFLNRDLSSYLLPAAKTSISFQRRYPVDFMRPAKGNKLLAWHLVGGLDAVDAAELTGQEPVDHHPVLLEEWIERDGLKCLKVKVRGTDAAWDYERLIKVGKLAIRKGAWWLSADFNCTVRDAAYVNDILDRLRDEEPQIYGMILYVEQPFPYELEQERIDVHSVSARKPLFLDESAHDWKMIQLGRELGWTGVALKTCKTQTGAILSACWARAHGMELMVQDLTNPMLAQIPHVQLAARVGTIMGVETNGMQFYPEASTEEAKIHPGIYERRQGSINLETIRGAGFGYRVEEINRDLSGFSQPPI